MTYEQFNQHCGSLIASSYVMQWGNSHVWKVAGKVFAIGGQSKDGDATFTFKVSERNYEFLKMSEGYRPAPYFATRGMKWIQQYDANTVDDEALIYYINESYRLVSLGLSKKLQKQFGLNQM